MSTRVTQSLDDGRTTFRAPEPGESPQAALPTEGQGKAQVIDPVCGMDVDPAAPNVVKSERGGTTFYFCSQACRDRFESSPEEFIAAT